MIFLMPFDRFSETTINLIIIALTNPTDSHNAFIGDKQVDDPEFSLVDTEVPRIPLQRFTVGGSWIL